MTLDIKDKKGNSKIIFSDFKLSSELEPIIIDCNINIATSCFKSSSSIIIELLDIKEFYKNLTILQDNLKWTFHFQHNDERIHLVFQPNELGSIAIKGTFKSIDYKDKLEFVFETDQTYIDDLLQQCEEIMSEFK